jgi:DeoR/GlpR family transcriptional regulator of sugar metabolism
MMQDKRTARFNQLTSILRKNGGARISELAGILSVSHMTVRRDLEILERQGVVNVFHGSVVFMRSAQAPRPSRVVSISQKSWK